jgi:hypothetical protein
VTEVFFFISQNMDNTLKEFRKLLPSFSAPARTWIEKISLLTEVEKPNDALNKAILTLLPPSLFDQLIFHKCSTPKELLNKISSLESFTQPQAAHKIFSSPPAISNQQLPSTYYYEQLRTVLIAFPEMDKRQASNLAWERTVICLSENTRNLLLVLPEPSDLEAKLHIVDRAWQQQDSSARSIIATATQPLQSSTTIEKSISELVDRIEGLEAAIRERPQFNHKNFKSAIPTLETKTDGHTCYYHRQFGRQARKCQPPCRFYAHPAKWNGAPSP